MIKFFKSREIKILRNFNFKVVGTISKLNIWQKNNKGLFYEIKTNSHEMRNNSSRGINTCLCLAPLTYHLKKIKEHKNQSQQVVFMALNHKYGTKHKRWSLDFKSENKNTSLIYSSESQWASVLGKPGPVRVTGGSLKSRGSFIGVANCPACPCFLVHVDSVHHHRD